MRKTKSLWFTVFAVIIALTMAATVFLAAGFAEDTPEDGYVLVGNIGRASTDNVALYYNASTKTAKISGQGRIKNFNPDDAYFLDTSSLPVKDAESVIIEDGITNISQNLFLSSKIKSAIIPNSVTEISAYAFKDCHGLESLTIPGTVTSIGNSAFYNCASLRSLTLPNRLRSIGHDAFRDCVNLKTVSIPSATGFIDCFSGCTALEEITLPEGVTALGDREIYDAFKDCASLKRVTLPSTLAKIDEDSFSGCTALESVVFAPGSTADIPANCFAGCAALTEVVLPDKMTSIGAYAFSGCTGLSEIVLPDNMTSIGEYAFSGCTGLSEIVVPDGAQTLGDGIFEGCTALTKVTLPGRIQAIPARAFYNCAALQKIGFGAEDTPADGKVVFPKGLYSILDDAFTGCSQITSVSFPQSVSNVSGMWGVPIENLTEIFFCRNTLLWDIRDFRGTVYTCWDSKESFCSHIRNTPYGSSYYDDNSYTLVTNYHNMVFVPEKPAIRNSGVKEHYECTRCGGYFKDADGVEKYSSEESLRIPVPDNFFDKMINFFRKIFLWIKSIFVK